MADVSLPNNTASNIGDTKHLLGSGVTTTGADARLGTDYAAGVFLTILDSKKTAATVDLWVEITNCDAKVVKAGAKNVLLRVNKDKWAGNSGGWALDGTNHPNQCCIRVHDSKGTGGADDWKSWRYGPPASPVTPGYVETWVNLTEGQVTAVPITIDPVSTGKIVSVKVSADPTFALNGTSRYASQRTDPWEAKTADADSQAQPGSPAKSQRGGAPVFIRGAKRLRADAITDPPGLPVRWKVVGRDGSASDVSLGTWGPSTTVAMDRQGGWMLAACAQPEGDPNAVWVYWAFEVVSVSLVDGSASTSGNSKPCWLDYTADGTNVVGVGSGTSNDAKKVFFVGNNVGDPADKGWYAKLKVQISALFAASLQKVALAMVQNVISPDDYPSTGIIVSYSDGSRTYKKMPGKVWLDSQADFKGEMLGGDNMVTYTPDGLSISKDSELSSKTTITVDMQVCDSPSPVVPYKKGDAKWVSQTGKLNFRSAIVACTADVPWQLVAIAECQWSFDASATKGSVYGGNPSGSVSPGTFSARNPPTDVGKGGANYDTAGPGVIWAVTTQSL